VLKVGTNGDTRTQVWRDRRKKDLYAHARKGYLVSAEEKDDGTVDFLHDKHLILVDEKRRIRGYYDATEPKEVDRLIGDIKVLLNEWNSFRKFEF